MGYLHFEMHYFHSEKHYFAAKIHYLHFKKHRLEKLLKVKYVKVGRRRRPSPIIAGGIGRRPVRVWRCAAHIFRTKAHIVRPLFVFLQRNVAK